MKVDVLLGLQWGDEGKGKIVDVLTPEYDMISRFQGGPNAGHTLIFNNTKHVLHTIPSGVFREDTENVIGNGVVIDPVIFKSEIANLKQADVAVEKVILISKKAHLILPTHRMLDAASEQAKGKGKIGSTLKGIGPTYMDKTGRNGLRVGDTEADNFKEQYDTLKNKHLALLSHYDFDTSALANLEKEWFAAVEEMKAIPFIDSEHHVNRARVAGKRILAEGAQGSLLDIDFGSYPFVTSSNTIAAGACTGLGIAPGNIGEVYGIFKAYCTRVGSGPFPTELFDDNGKELAEKGHEFGATTGRPRRCGWLDLPALKYATMLNGVTQLIMTKADVMSDMDTIQICTHYKYRGEVIDYLPYDICNFDAEPVYKEIPGWKTDLTDVSSPDQFPSQLNDYIAFIEKEVGIPVKIVSVGPDREQTIILD
jgi:adenylosuccinate synthase